MKQKKMLSLTLSQIRQLYCQELPELTAMAQQSLDDTDFKNHLQEFLTPYISGGNKAGEQIRLLSATTERLFMSCLTNRICKYRPYLFSDAS